MMSMPTLSTEQFVSALLRQLLNVNATHPKLSTVLRVFAHKIIVAPLVRQLPCLHQRQLVSSVVTLFPNHRKPHENPAIGVLLCASKDDEVVEYALSRSLSPAMIAEYKTQLPDKKLLQTKLHEFYLLNIAQAEGL
jgi:hypothetical protein